MKILCLGDSLTYGYGVPRRDCWVSLAALRSGHELVNCGINGDTTGGMLARFASEVLPQRSDRLLLMGGANDIILTGSDRQARANLGAIAQQAVAKGIRPMLGLPVPVYPSQVPAPWSDMADFFVLEPVFSSYRDWLISFAATFGFQTVDFAVEGLLPPEGGRLYLDGLHPNQEGHRLMADALCPLLPPLSL